MKTINKMAFLGAFLLGFMGIFVGGAAAVIIWPESNLGPPFGAAYGLIIGIVVGFVGGLILGCLRAAKSRAARNNERKE